MYKKAWCTCKVVVLPFSFSSPSSLLKLPLVMIQKFCYHGNVTSHFSSLKNQLAPTATRTSNLRPLLRMLAWQEERRRWVRGCIKITESMHAYEFQVLLSALFFWSAACRYSCSQKWYPLTIITRPYRGLRYFTPWVEILADAPHIFCRGNFCSAEKRSAQLAFLQIPRRAFLCVFVCVVFRAWMKHTRFEGSLLLKLVYLSGFAVSSITDEAPHL